MIEFEFSIPKKFSYINPSQKEAYAFRTYLGYWACLAEHIQREYDFDYIRILKELRDRPGFRRLAGKETPTGAKEIKEIRSRLLNGWISEARLNLIDLDDKDRLRLANHGAPVDAYYATSRLAEIWSYIRTGNFPKTHEALLNFMSQEIGHGTLYPCPWNLMCTAIVPEPAYSGFTSPPGKISGLALAADRYDRSGMLLRTTRDRRIKDLAEAEKRTCKTLREATEICDRRTKSTTIFNFAWRMRKRSNYDDPAMFHSGTPNHEQARLFAAAIRTWTDATMLVFEALIAQRARDVLLDTATEFARFDHSGLADKLVMARLQAIGIA